MAPDGARHCRRRGEASRVLSGGLAVGTARASICHEASLFRLMDEGASREGSPRLMLCRPPCDSPFCRDGYIRELWLEIPLLDGAPRVLRGPSLSFPPFGATKRNLAALGSQWRCRHTDGRQRNSLRLSGDNELGALWSCRIRHARGARVLHARRRNVLRSVSARSSSCGTPRGRMGLSWSSVPFLVNFSVLPEEGYRCAVRVGSDNTVKLRHAATGTTRAILTGHSDSGLTVAFSPEGRALATGSRDKTARLWDTQNGVTGGVLTGHTHHVASVDFGTTGRTLATSSYDNTVRLW